MRTPIAIALLLGLSLPAWSDSLPESVQVRFQSLPAGAEVIWGLHARPGRVEGDPCGVTGETVILRRAMGSHSNHYDAGGKTYQVRFKKEGFADQTFTVSLDELLGPPPVLLPQSPLQLQPLTARAWLSLHPGITVSLALTPLLLLAAGLTLRGRKHKLEEALRLKSRAVAGGELVGITLGRYHLLEKLGAGGMASVYRAEKLEGEGKGSDLALKLLHQQGSADPKYRDRFYREAVIGARLRHPNLVLLHEAVEAGGYLGLAMELVRGTTLRRFIDPRGLPLARALQFFAPIVEGVAYAHGQGVVHRDLKPENVMVDEAGGVKVMDFGIARLESAAKLTESGTIMGTLAYMAPEQARGAEVGPATDQYALGIMLFEMLTGQVPFTSEVPLDMLRMHLERRPPPVTVSKPELGSAVAQVLERMLEKQPEQRFPHLDEALRALRACL